jgi:hypothetical protein
LLLKSGVKAGDAGHCAQAPVLPAITNPASNAILNTRVFVLILLSFFFSRAHNETWNAIELSSDKARTLGNLEISQPGT